MKHLYLGLLVTLFSGAIIAQTTAIPDANFEQRLIDLGYDFGVPNGVVLTSNISSITNIYLGNRNISDLSGIEDFVALNTLDCRINQLTTLNLSQNTYLTYLVCSNNQLTTLDLSQNPDITYINFNFNQLSSLDLSLQTDLETLWCGANILTNLDVSNNLALTSLQCSNNQLTSLDLSQNTLLNDFNCIDNNLTSLNIKNGNNINMGNAAFRATYNTNLYCIEVDNIAYSTSNYTYIDSFASFSTNCCPGSILSTDSINACAPYTWTDGNSYSTNNNTAMHTLTSLFGCDSIITLNLTILNSSNGIDTRTECDSLTWIDGITYSSNNNIATFNAVGIAANGCDSLVTLDLTIINSSIGIDTRTECDSITWIDGVTYSSSNNTAIFSIAGAATNGCDSLVTLDLTINPTLYTTSNQLICQGDSLLIYGSYQNTAGVYYDSLQSTIGCDSILSTVLTINPVSSFTQSKLIIQGDSILLGGIYQSNTGIYYDSLQAINGCDSILTTILTTVPISQATIIPDPNFEQALIALGLDVGTPDGIVLTANIDTIINLDVSNKNISDLTGVEDFTALTNLELFSNNLSSINVTQNLNLTVLGCSNNKLTSIDVTQNITLDSLALDDNIFLTHLDLSQNTGLTFLICLNNQLTCLNVKNGNNNNFTYFDATDNPNLTCIEVDDSTWSANNWSNIDPSSSFSTNCNNSCIGLPCNVNANYTFTDNGSGNYSFINSSTGSFNQSHWAFGDGTIDSIVNPNHTFTTNGFFTVILTILDSTVLGDSCTSYYLDTINVTGVTNPSPCNSGFVIYPDTTGNVTIVNNATGNNLNYLWDFGDGNTSNLQNPSHTYATAGPFYLCLTIDDGNGCADMYCDSIGKNGVVFNKAGRFNINVISPNTTGIDNNVNLNLEINIYPNPTSNLLTIDTEQNISEINIIDITGKTVMVTKEKTKVLNVIDLSDGIYFIQLITDERTITKKFVKQ